MQAPETYYLSSLDSARFEPVRECTVRRHMPTESGKAALIVDLNPPVPGQDFDRAGDISTVVLAARFEGSTVAPIDEFPCFVHIAIPRANSPIGYDSLGSAELQVIGWGELYRTAEDARAHRFG